MKKKIGVIAMCAVMLVTVSGCNKSSTQKIETNWQSSTKIAEMLGYADGISGEVNIKLTFYTDKTVQMETTRTKAEITAEDTLTGLDGKIFDLGPWNRTIISQEIFSLEMSLPVGIFKGTFSGNTKKSTENNNEVKITFNQFAYQGSEEFEDINEEEMTNIIVTIGNNTLSLGDWEFKKI